MTLVTFTLDESSYSRELAPMAGHYPARVLQSTDLILIPHSSLPNC